MTDHNGWQHLRDIEGTLSQHLAGKTIVVAVSASVAALETHRLTRTLMRHGASVTVFMTPEASRLVSPTALEWCTGRPPITELTGRCEHLEYFGSRGVGDLLLLAPATANTVAKVALGLDDNAVTTAVTTALGSRVPVLLCPGMHEPMLENPAVQANLARLEQWGVEVLPPKVSEGKAKMMDVAEIVARVLRRLGGGELAGQQVLLTGGATREFLDPARCLTNPSSGVSACLLAAEAYRRGAKVRLVYGAGQAVPPPWIEVHRVDTTEQMAATVERLVVECSTDWALAVAAVADYRPSERAARKVATQSQPQWQLSLERTPKVIDGLRSCSPATRLVAFKASSQTEEVEMVREASEYLRQGRADFVVSNPILRPGLGFEQPENHYLLCAPDRDPRSLGPAPKERLAVELWQALLEPSS